MSNIPLIIRLVANSVSIAKRAGSIIKHIVNKGELGIVEKGIRDYQTEADRAAQRCIVGSLCKNFKNITVIGEENLDQTETTNDLVDEYDEEVLRSKCPSNLINIQEQQIVVWVDPLDGTYDFTEGNLEAVTVLIGIAIDGQAISGVIHQPYYEYQVKNIDKVGRTVWGIVGLGVFGLSQKELPSNECIITRTKNHWNEEMGKCIKAINPTKEIITGGGGAKALLVLGGDAHAYICPTSGLKKWDTCATDAIIRSAGGIVVDILGNDIPYHKDSPHVNDSGFLAAMSAEKVKTILAAIPEDIKLKALHKISKY